MILSGLAVTVVERSFKKPVSTWVKSCTCRIAGTASLAEARLASRPVSAFRARRRTQVSSLARCFCGVGQLARVLLSSRAAAGTADYRDRQLAEKLLKDLDLKTTLLRFCLPAISAISAWIVDVNSGPFLTLYVTAYAALVVTVFF